MTISTFIYRPAKHDYMKFASAITATFPKEFRVNKYFTKTCHYRIVWYVIIYEAPYT